MNINWNGAYGDFYNSNGLSDAVRADLARQLDCQPSEVEARLEARDRMEAYIRERREREDPMGYSRSRY